MIKTLITEFPLSDFPKERTIHRGENKKVHLHQRGSRCTDL